MITTITRILVILVVFVIVVILFMLDSLRHRLKEEGSLTLTLRVRPKAGENRVRGVQNDGVLRIDVKSLPEDGEANADVIALLSEFFAVPKASVTLVSGHRGRTKIVRIGDSGRHQAG